MWCIVGATKIKWNVLTTRISVLCLKCEHTHIARTKIKYCIWNTYIVQEETVGMKYRSSWNSSFQIIDITQFDQLTNGWNGTIHRSTSKGINRWCRFCQHIFALKLIRWTKIECSTWIHNCTIPIVYRGLFHDIEKSESTSSAMNMKSKMTSTLFHKIWYLQF